MSRCFDPFDLFPHPERTWAVSPVQWDASRYVEGRRIGDEYQYILDRKLSKRFAGSQLRRPGLLLNPWALDESHSAPLTVEDGEMLADAPRSERVAGQAHSRRRAISHPSDFANVDFLPRGAFIAANLRPGEDGTLRVPMTNLAGRHHVVVLLVDPTTLEMRRTRLPKGDWQPLDRRLTNGFKPDRNIVRMQRSILLHEGQSLHIEDAANARFQIYDSLSSALQVLKSLQPDERLTQFEFLARWGSLSEADKLARYDELACHELHLFCYQKDRDFFNRVIRPHVENKMHPSFMDEWLLERDLSRFRQSWEYDRLNGLERILLGKASCGRARIDAAVGAGSTRVGPPRPGTSGSTLSSGVGGASDAGRWTTSVWYGKSAGSPVDARQVPWECLSSARTFWSV